MTAPATSQRPPRRHRRRAATRTTDVVVDARDVNKWFGRLHVLKDVCSR